jgi:hypothetical protein
MLSHGSVSTVDDSIVSSLVKNEEESETSRALYSICMISRCAWRRLAVDVTNGSDTRQRPHAYLRFGVDRAGRAGMFAANELSRIPARGCRIRLQPDQGAAVGACPGPSERPRLGRKHLVANMRKLPVSFQGESLLWRESRIALLASDWIQGRGEQTIMWNARREV